MLVFVVTFARFSHLHTYLSYFFRRPGTFMTEHCMHLTNSLNYLFLEQVLKYLELQHHNPQVSLGIHWFELFQLICMGSQVLNPFRHFSVNILVSVNILPKFK